MSKFHFFKSLHFLIFLSLALGVFFGLVLGEGALVFEPLGFLFIRLLKLILIPIIFTSIVSGVISIGNISTLSKMGAKTTMYYIITTFSAIFIGMVVVNMIQPGTHSAVFKDTIVMTPPPLEEFSLLRMLETFIPENIFQAVLEANTVGFIFFSLVLGIAIASVGHKADVLAKGIRGLNEVMLKITNWIMWLSPIGLFGLIAAFTGEMGLAIFKPLGYYIITVISGLAIHVGLILFVLLIVFTKRSPITFLKQIFPALGIAFSTDSSVATLPVTMECLEKNAKVSKKVVQFVAPIGATLNMDGTALYEAVAALFIAQVFGIELSFYQQIIVFLTAGIASVGAAGIPSAGLVTLVMVLQAVNLPVEGVGLLLAVDRLIDMCRTTVNVVGDCVGAAVIDRMMTR